MRGKADIFDFLQFGIGITPAHAGKSCIVKTVEFQCQDHPRTCGEKEVSHQFLCDFWGSPPHMRGKGKGSFRRRFCCGITPAHAGKSQLEPETYARREDHPRTCGEKHLVQALFLCR